MNRQSRIENILKSNFKVVLLQVENESHQHSVPVHSETHFKVLLVSDEFDGLNRLDRSRKVNELLKEELQTGLHALSLRLFSVSEWDKHPDNYSSPVCHTKSNINKI